MSPVRQIARPSKRFFLALASTVALMPGGGVAAEYMHCYLRDAPADAAISSEYNVSGIPGAIGIAALRHACGVPTDADQVMLDDMVAAGQCSPDSEISGFVRETFDVSASDARADMVSQSSEDVVVKLCEAATACEPGQDGYSAECEAAIDAALGG